MYYFQKENKLRKSKYKFKKKYKTCHNPYVFTSISNDKIKCNFKTILDEALNLWICEHKTIIQSKNLNLFNIFISEEEAEI